MRVCTYIIYSYATVFGMYQVKCLPFNHIYTYICRKAFNKTN